MYPLTDWRNSISRINFTELPLSKDIKHMYSAGKKLKKLLSSNGYQKAEK